MSSETHVILGAGHAGAHAAIEMRKAGFAGRILLVGEEPHLPYERPPLSKELLVAELASPQWLLDEAKLDEHAIDTLLGDRVTSLDPVARMLGFADGRTLGFDKVLLAVGGVARSLPVPGGEHALTLRSLDDAHRLRDALGPGSRVAIVGAGVIGLEVASSAAKLGCTVTVIEREDGPMARSATREVQHFINALHHRNGVTLRYGAMLGAIERAQDCLRLDLGDGDVLDADVVVAGIGLAPNLDLARKAGLAVDGGILVDQFGATSAAGVYAAGDVTSFWHRRYDRHLHWQTWQHAQNHGKAVARAMVGQAEPYAPASWFWSDQHGVNMQFAGQPLESEKTVFRGDPASDCFAAFHLRDGAIVGATFINSGGMVRPTQALIASGQPVSIEALGDPAIPLQKLPHSA